MKLSINMNPNLDIEASDNAEIKDVVIEDTVTGENSVEVDTVAAGEADVPESPKEEAPAIAQPVVKGITCTDAGHLYTLPSGQTITFIKRLNGELIHEGTTNEELLMVLIHRTNVLNAKFPCRENAIAITKMEEALMWFDERTAKRQAQGIETLDVAHEDKQHD